MLKSIIDSLIITVLVFIFMWVVSNIPLIENLEMLNPIENVFNDFDMTDIVYSQLRGDVEADTNIVVVNIGNLPRQGMADLIASLNRNNPKVIGIDAFSRNPLDPYGDSLYSAVLSQVENLVMVNQGNLSEATRVKLDTIPDLVVESFDTLETSNEMFTQYATQGHANLLSESRGNMQDFVTIRTFSPYVKVNDDKIEAFAVKIAEVIDPDAAKKFLARNNTYEFINYRGNIDIADRGKPVFWALDWQQVLDPEADLSWLKGKILILGFMGETLNSYSYVDKFYTPLNKNYVGKSTLDMYGVVIHANIVSMILNRDFINTMPEWLNIILMVFITFLCTLLFSYFFHKVGYWYDAITIFFQLAIFILILGIGLYAFDWYNLRVEITTAIIAVILSGIFVEIYHGLIKKLFITIKSKNVKIKQTNNETV